MKSFVFLFHMRHPVVKVIFSLSILQFDAEYSLAHRLLNTMRIWSHTPTMHKWLFSFRLLPTKTQIEGEVQKADHTAPR